MNKKEDFESNIKQLEEIVRKLEKGDAPLEQMLQMFEQGIALTRQCQKTLEQAEQRVSIL